MKRFSKEAIERLNRELLEDVNEGSYYTLRRKEISDNETVALRIIPSITGNVAYYFKKVGFFVQPDDEFKYLVSMASFGQQCNVSAALNKLITKKPEYESLFSNAGDAFQRSVTYLIPCLVLDDIESKKGNIESYTIRKGKPCIFEAPQSVITAINNLMIDPAYENDADDGFLDRVEGFTLYITKVVQKKKTSYKVTCSRNPNEIFETEFYENPFDLLGEVKKMTHSDEYITAVLKSFATGSSIPDPTFMSFDDEESEEEVEMEEEEEVKPKTTSTTKKAPKEGYKSSLLKGVKRNQQEEEE